MGARANNPDMFPNGSMRSSLFEQEVDKKKNSPRTTRGRRFFPSSRNIKKHEVTSSSSYPSGRGNRHQEQPEQVSQFSYSEVETKESHNKESHHYDVPFIPETLATPEMAIQESQGSPHAWDSIIMPHVHRGISDEEKATEHVQRPQQYSSHDLAEYYAQFSPRRIPDPDITDNLAQIPIEEEAGEPSATESLITDVPSAANFSPDSLGAKKFSPHLFQAASAFDPAQSISTPATIPGTSATAPAEELSGKTNFFGSASSYERPSEKPARKSRKNFRKKNSASSVPSIPETLATPDMAITQNMPIIYDEEDADERIFPPSPHARRSKNQLDSTRNNPQYLPHEEDAYGDKFAPPPPIEFTSTQGAVAPDNSSHHETFTAEDPNPPTNELDIAVPLTWDLRVHGPHALPYDHYDNRIYTPPSTQESPYAPPANPRATPQTVHSWETTAEHDMPLLAYDAARFLPHQGQPYTQTNRTFPHKRIINQAAPLQELPPHATGSIFTTSTAHETTSIHPVDSQETTTETTTPTPTTPSLEPPHTTSQAQPESATITPQSSPPASYYKNFTPRPANPFVAPASQSATEKPKESLLSAFVTQPTSSKHTGKSLLSHSLLDPPVETKKDSEDKQLVAEDTTPSGSPDVVAPFLFDQGDDDYDDTDEPDTPLFYAPFPAVEEIESAENFPATDTGLYIQEPEHRVHAAIEEHTASSQPPQDETSTPQSDQSFVPESLVSAINAYRAGGVVAEQPLAQPETQGIYEPEQYYYTPESTEYTHYNAQENNSSAAAFKTIFNVPARDFSFDQQIDADYIPYDDEEYEEEREITTPRLIAELNLPPAPSKASVILTNFFSHPQYAAQILLWMTVIAAFMLTINDFVASIRQENYSSGVLIAAAETIGILQICVGVWLHSMMFSSHEHNKTIRMFKQLFADGLTCIGTIAVYIIICASYYLDIGSWWHSVIALLLIMALSSVISYLYNSPFVALCSCEGAMITTGVLLICKGYNHAPHSAFVPYFVGCVITAFVVCCSGWDWLLWITILPAALTVFATGGSYALPACVSLVLVNMCSAAVISFLWKKPIVLTTVLCAVTPLLLLGLQEPTHRVGFGQIAVGIIFLLVVVFYPEDAYLASNFDDIFARTGFACIAIGAYQFLHGQYYGCFLTILAMGLAAISLIYDYFSAFVGSYILGIAAVIVGFTAHVSYTIVFSTDNQIPRKEMLPMAINFTLILIMVCVLAASWVYRTKDKTSILIGTIIGAYTITGMVVTIIKIATWKDDVTSSQLGFTLGHAISTVFLIIVALIMLFIGISHIVFRIPGMTLFGLALMELVFFNVHTSMALIRVCLFLIAGPLLLIVVVVCHNYPVKSAPTAPSGMLETAGTVDASPSSYPSQQSRTRNSSLAS